MTMDLLANVKQCVSVREYGRFLKWSMAGNRAVRQYNFPSGLTVIECDNRDWPVVMTGGEGEFHIWRVSSPTMRTIITTIRECILAPSAPRPKFKLWRPRPADFRYPVGDDIVLAFEWGSWGICKLNEGMAPERIGPEHLRVLADLLEHLLTKADALDAPAQAVDRAFVRFDASG